MKMPFQSVIYSLILVNFTLPEIAYTFEWAKIPLLQLKLGNPIMTGLFKIIQYTFFFS